MAESQGALTPNAAPADPPTVDPAAIPAPPKVDLTTPQTWARNPFAVRRSIVPTEKPPVSTALASRAADPVVRSILYSSQRRVALVDNRFVGVGDQISAGRVVAIERDAIVIETPAGAQRRVALRGRAPAGTNK